MTIDEALLDLLVCPECHSKVREASNGAEIACLNAECGLIYPVRDDIPVMLIDQARRADAGD